MCRRGNQTICAAMAAKLQAQGIRTNQARRSEMAQHPCPRMKLDKGQPSH